MADITGKKPSEFSQATIDKLIEVLKILILEGIPSPEIYFKSSAGSALTKARLVLLGETEFDIVLYDSDGNGCNMINMNLDGENEYSSGKAEIDGLGSNPDARHVFYVSNTEIFRFDNFGRMISLAIPVAYDNNYALSNEFPVFGFYRDNSGFLRQVSENPPTSSQHCVYQMNLGDSLPADFYPDELRICLSGLTESTEVPSISEYYLQKVLYRWSVDDDEDGFSLLQHGASFYGNSSISVAGQVRLANVGGNKQIDDSAIRLNVISDVYSSFEAIFIYNRIPMF